MLHMQPFELEGMELNKLPCSNMCCLMGSDTIQGEGVWGGALTNDADRLLEHRPGGQV